MFTKDITLIKDKRLKKVLVAGKKGRELRAKSLKLRNCLNLILKLLLR